MSRFFCVPFGCKYTIDIDPVPLSGALTTRSFVPSLSKSADVSDVPK